MDAILLAAGLGTRLRPHTLTTPKPLLAVQGRPILDWLVAALPPEVNRLVVVVHYLAEQVEEMQPHEPAAENRRCADPGVAIALLRRTTRRNADARRCRASIRDRRRRMRAHRRKKRDTARPRIDGIVPAFENTLAIKGLCRIARRPHDTGAF